MVEKPAVAMWVWVSTPKSGKLFPLSMCDSIPPIGLIGLLQIVWGSKYVFIYWYNLNELTWCDKHACLRAHLLKPYTTSHFLPHNPLPPSSTHTVCTQAHRSTEPQNDIDWGLCLVSLS